MAAPKKNELRGMPEAELRQKIDEAKNELAAMRLKASQGTLEQPHQIQTRRREIARMLTIINEQARESAAKAR